MQSEIWPQRPLILAVLGAVSAFIIRYLTADIKPVDIDFNLQLSLAVAVAVSSLGFAICTRRSHLVGGVIYALFLGVVAGGISFWRLQIQWPQVFSFFALGLSLFVLSPYYQTALHSHWRDYRALHQHAWGNAVVIVLCLLFTGLCFGVAYLLAELFSLVGIDVLEHLLREELTRWLLGGVAMGASIGVLREHDTIIASTQALVQSVFALLVVPLAVGLGAFLLVLPFTGLESLWGATRNSSATLFACAAGALLILNAVIREDETSQSNNRIVQIASWGLALTIAPLALVSVFSLKLRIDQYGLTPDRLWASVVCLLLAAYGVGYFLSTMHRSKFFVWVRCFNLYLGVVVCAVSLLLASPLVDFGGVSVRNQLARLERGTTTEQGFDITAFAFDFGPAGRKALDSMRSTVSPELSARIDDVLEADNRWQALNLESQEDLQIIEEKLTIIPDSGQLPKKLLTALTQEQACRNDYCYLLWSNSDDAALIVDQTCQHKDSCRPEVYLFRRANDNWYRDYTHPGFDNAINEKDRSVAEDEYLKLLESAALQGKIKLRPVQRMQVFIGDEAVGPVIE